MVCRVASSSSSSSTIWSFRKIHIFPIFKKKNWKILNFLANLKTKHSEKLPNMAALYKLLDDKIKKNTVQLVMYENWIFDQCNSAYTQYWMFSQLRILTEKIEFHFFSFNTREFQWRANSIVTLPCQFFFRFCLLVFVFFQF